MENKDYKSQHIKYSADAQNTLVMMQKGNLPQYARVISVLHGLLSELRRSNIEEVKSFQKDGKALVRTKGDLASNLQPFMVSARTKKYPLLELITMRFWEALPGWRYLLVLQIREVLKPR